MNTPTLVSREGRDYMRFHDGEELLVMNRDLLAEEHRRQRPNREQTALWLSAFVDLCLAGKLNDGYKSLVALKHEHSQALDPWLMVAQQLSFSSHT